MEFSWPRWSFCWWLHQHPAAQGGNLGGAWLTWKQKTSTRMHHEGAKRPEFNHLSAKQKSNLPGGPQFLPPFSQLCLNPILLHALHILIHADLRVDPLEPGHMGATVFVLQGWAEFGIIGLASFFNSLRCMKSITIKMSAHTITQSLVPDLYLFIRICKLPRWSKFSHS